MNISHFPYILFNRFNLKIFGEIVNTIKLKKCIVNWSMMHKSVGLLAKSDIVPNYQYR